jgi:hypothetical protein
MRRITVSQDRQDNKTGSVKVIRYKNGKIYFSRETERKFFFILTVIMLLMGLFAKVGLF